MTSLVRPPGSSLHHVLSTVLRAAIASGKYGPGDNLPGENTLVSTYGVSRATVRRALLTLETEGLIDRQAGKGTRVRPPTGSFVSPSMETHKRLLERGHQRTSVRVLDISEVAAPANVARALRLPDMAPVVAITRVRSRGKLPLRYMTTYVEPAIGALLDQKTLRRTTVVSALEQLGHPVHRVEDEVGATLADPTLADALGRAVGDPLLDMTRTMFDLNGQPVAFQRTVTSPDVYKLRILITSEGDAVPALADIATFQPAE